MLRWRLLAAAVILGPLLGILILDHAWNFGMPGIWLIPVGAVVTLMAAAEVVSLLRHGGHAPAAWAVYGGASLVYVGGCLGAARAMHLQAQGLDAIMARLGWPLTSLTVAFVLVWWAEMLRFRVPGSAISNAAMAFFAVSYSGLLMSFLIQLRFFGSGPVGLAALVSVIFVVKMSDTGAYVCGKWLGRHKMSPVLSPAKTFEGAAGGLLVAAVASWLYFGFIAPWLFPETAAWGVHWGTWVYGIVVGAAGMIGDLCESLLKRDMRRKDSSTWVPGLGGVLDVLDSVLLAAPAGLCCWAAGLVGAPT